MRYLNNSSFFRFSLAVALSVFITACGTESKAPSASTAIDRPAKLSEVTSASGESLRTFPATVEPSNYAHLAFRVNGEVANILVSSGQQVKLGQLLAQVDDSDFVIQLKQAEARYQLSQSQFERAEKLLNDKLISSAEFDQIKAEMDIASAQVEAAKNNVKYSKIVAPFDGVIAHINVEPFEFVQAKQPIMEVHGRETVDVVIQVPEQLMIRLPKESKAKQYQPLLRFDDNPSKKYAVTLKEHDIVPNASTKSYQVVFSMPTPDDINVLPGMTGTLEVELNKLLENDSQALIVPVAALFVPNSRVAEYEKSGIQFVMKVDENMTTELVAVKVIEAKQSGMVVKSVNPEALNASDRVVAAGPHLLKEGQVVSEWTQERGL